MGIKYCHTECVIREIFWFASQNSGVESCFRFREKYLPENLAKLYNETALTLVLAITMYELH